MKTDRIVFIGGITIFFIALFLILANSAKAYDYDCIKKAHLIKGKGQAIFHNATDAQAWANQNNGTVFASKDGETFYVEYPAPDYVGIEEDLIDNCISS